MFDTIFIIDYSSPENEGLTRWNSVKDFISWSNWDLFAFNSLYYSLFLFTLPATIPVINFYNEGKGYFVNTYSRILNYKRSLLKSIKQYSCVSAICFSGPYVIYYLLVSTVTSGHVDSNIGILNSLGLSEVYNNAIIYFVFVGFIINFIFGFIYGLLACSITIWVEKIHFIILIPLVYYLVMSNISVSFDLPFISPLLGITYNGYIEVSLFQVIVPLLIPLITAITLIMLHFRKGDKFGV